MVAQSSESVLVANGLHTTTLDHSTAPRAVRHAKRTQPCLEKNDADLSTDGTINISPHEAHTSDNAPREANGIMERVLVRSRIGGVVRKTMRRRCHHSRSRGTQKWTHEH